EVFHQLLAQGFIAVCIGEKELDGLEGGLYALNVLALPLFNLGLKRHQFALNARIARTRLPGTLTDAPAGIALRTTDVSVALVNAAFDYGLGEAVVTHATYHPEHFFDLDALIAQMLFDKDGKELAHLVCRFFAEEQIQMCQATTPIHLTQSA